MSNKELIKVLRDYQHWMQDGINGEPSIVLEDICGEETFGAAADALEAMEWQPIDGSPKDGTQIDAFAHGRNHPKDFFYGVAEWADADPDFPRTVSGWFWPYAIRPTHWKPLTPPEGE